MTPDEARRQAPDRARRRRVRPRRPTAIGAACRGSSRCPRPALRRAHAAQEPGLRAGRHRHPRPRHRRELGDLHRGQRGGAAAAALRRRRSHRAALAHAAAVDLRRDADVLAVAGQLPRLGGAELVVRGDGDLPRRPADADRPGRARRGARACAPRRASCRSSALQPIVGRGFTPDDDRAGGPAHGAARARRSGAPASAPIPPIARPDRSCSTSRPTPWSASCPTPSFLEDVQVWMPLLVDGRRHRASAPTTTIAASPS